MNKVISAFKKHWNKAVAVFCVVAIVFVTSFSMTSVYAVTSWADVAEDAISVRDAYFTYWFSHKSSFGDFIKQASDIPVSWLKFVDSFGWVISPVDDLYYYLNDSKDLMVAAGGGGGHSRTALHGGGGYCRTCRKPSDECTCEFFESEADGFDPVINGSDLKQIYTDYSLMYAPMPTPSQYLYNYQSATGIKETSYGYHQFNPYAPVFRYGKGYGADVGQASGWSNGCYVLPYIFDDDLHGTYYSWGYWHFYHKTEDNIRYICADYISLADDSDVTHFESAWKMSEKGASYGLATFANYFALCSYNSDTLYLQCSQSTADFSLLQLSVGRDKFLALNGKITDLVSKSFTSFLQASTFTPQTNTADDWGYIMSETPFELFKDQTSIDFSRIPNNYTITINGDTIYDYSITNPDTGDSTTIKKYVDDDYDFPQVPDVPDVPDPGDDSGTGGKVEVSGKIDVSGKVGVDVNVNVNSGSSSNPDPGDYINPGTVDTNLDHYLEQVPELSKGFIDYLKDFFAWLPDEIYGLIILGLVVMIFCRLAGR